MTTHQLKSWFSTKDASGLERTVTEPYVFESAEDNVVKIPHDEKKQKKELKELMDSLVHLESEAHRIDIQIQRTKDAIKSRQIALATHLHEEYQEVGINVPIPGKN